MSKDLERRDGREKQDNENNVNPEDQQSSMRELTPCDTVYNNVKVLREHPRLNLAIEVRGFQCSEISSIRRIIGAVFCSSTGMNTQAILALSFYMRDESRSCDDRFQDDTNHFLLHHAQSEQYHLNPPNLSLTSTCHPSVCLLG